MGLFSKKPKTNRWSTTTNKNKMAIKSTEVKKKTESADWRKIIKYKKEQRETKNQELQEKIVDADSFLLPIPEERPKHLPGNRFLSIVIMSVVFILSLLVLIGLEIRHNSLGRNVSILMNQKIALIEENRRYKADMYKLIAIDDLETVAKESLGLVFPDEGQIIIIP
jgi:hypothetical protein